jgi:hypothetical protein
VEDKGASGSALTQRHAQSSADQRSIERGTHGPAHDAATKEIEHRDQIEPALTGEDASGVAHPDLIATLDAEVAEAIGRDRSAVTTVGRLHPILRALASKEPLRAHEPRDTIAPSRTTQDPSQPWAAIGLATAGKLPPDPGAQVRGLELARTGFNLPFLPIVITTARDEQRFA